MLFVIAFMEFDGYETWSKWVPEHSFWWALTYAVVFVSCINFTVETWAIHRSSATTAALFMTLEPALTASFSWLILREPIRWQAVIGAIVVVLGILLSLPNGSNGEDKVSREKQQYDNTFEGYGDEITAGTFQLNKFLLYTVRGLPLTCLNVRRGTTSSSHSTRRRWCFERAVESAPYLYHKTKSFTQQAVLY